MKKNFLDIANFYLLMTVAIGAILLPHNAIACDAYCPRYETESGECFYNGWEGNGDPTDSACQCLFYNPQGKCMSYTGCRCLNSSTERDRDFLAFASFESPHLSKLNVNRSL